MGAPRRELEHAPSEEWFVSHGEYRGKATVSHSGSWAQFATFVVHFPQQRLGVIVLANSGSVNPTRAAYDVADAFLGDELGPRTQPGAMASGPAVSVAPTTLDRYTGLYGGNQ